MCKKLFFISAFILLLLTSTFAFAAYDAAYWSNNTGDRNWHNPYNWECTFDPPAYGYCVPDLTIPAFIEPVSPGPNIIGDACCAALYVHPWAWYGAPNTILNILPSAGFVNCGTQIGICSVLNYDSASRGHGIINMSGGTVFTSVSGTDAGLWVGGSGSKTGDFYGVLNISGGLMSVPKIGVYYGIVNLYDGVLEGTSNSPSDFIVSDSKAMTRINIAGGTLQLNGERILEIYESGRIVPYEQRGYLIVDFNVSTPYYTTATAILDWGVAFNPNPVHSQSEVSLLPILTWSTGDYVRDVNEHQIYLGTSFADVHEATVNNPLNVYMGVCDLNNFTPLELLEPNTTYYWRIDEVNDANIDSPWKGNIWRFTTTVTDWKIAQNPSPFDGQNKVMLSPTLTWTPGYYANDAGGHQVYFGTSFSDVNDADTSSSGIYKGVRDVNNYIAEGPLDVNKVYYWRIDEVNDTNPDSPWKGNVWHFTTTPCHGSGLAGDFNGDCVVNLYDVKIFTQEWLTAGSVANIYPIPLDGIVDFGDFAMMANNWLVEQY